MIFICPKCNNEIKTSREKHVNSCDGTGPRRLKQKLYPGKRGGWNNGKKLEDVFEPKKVKEIKEKMSKNHKGGGLASTPEKETIRCNKIRDKILERYANGWESSAGRTKKIIYESNIAGIVKVDGSWELGVCKYLDKNNINWIRNIKRFKYFDSTNKERSYSPDFYLSEINTYIEVKGYIRDLDKYKWDQFTGKLEIWDKKILKEKGII